MNIILQIILTFRLLCVKISYLYIREKYLYERTKIMKKTLALVMSLCMILSVCFFSVSADEATVGSVAADYTPEGLAITNAAEFAAMAADGVYYLANDITLDATWNAGAAVSETYADNTAFTGTLDGNGKTVTTTAPLFANLQGTVKNLTIEGAIADTTLHSANLSMWSKGTAVVDNVYTKATINAAKSAGGIFGYCATGSNVTITNCRNDANITCSDQVGGMIGYIQDDILVVDNCVNYGDLTTANYGAGIIGRFGRDKASAPDSDAKITNCVNYGKVVGAKGQTAGILGYLVGAGYVADCVNYGEIENATSTAGGIFGAPADKADQVTILIERCVNYGKVTAPAVIGGIAGRLGRNSNHPDGSFRIENCLNYGDVSATATVGYTATIYMGGIAGYSYGGGGTHPNGIINCVNAGNITVDSTNSTGSTYIGGFTGYVNSSHFEIKNNVNAGNITLVGNATTICATVYNKNAENYNTANNYTVAIDGIAVALTGETPVEAPSFATAVSADQIANGTVAGLINEAAGATIYYQAIGTDKAPVLTPAEDGSNAIVKNADGTFGNPVKEPETTEPAPETTEPAPETTEPGSSSNTGDSFVVFAAIAVVAVLGVAVVAKRREN